MTVNTHIFFFGLIAFPKTKLIISLPVTGLILISFTKTGLKMTLFPKKNQLHTQ